MSTVSLSTSWPAILQAIAARVTRQQYATWFQNLRVSTHTPDELNIRVPNRFFREWLLQNYLSVIQQAVEEVAGTRPDISFTVDESVSPKPPPDAEPPAPAGTHSSALPTQGMPLSKKYIFDNFVVGPSNQLAHAAALAVTESPGLTYNPLFLYGSVGLGKSHLLQAICQANLPTRPRQRLAYLSCETFVNEFISAIQRNDLPAFRGRYRLLDLLLIDDIQFLSRAERSQEEFFHTFNELYNAQKQIVLSCDQPPHEISGLQERLISRFKSGLVARMDPPSYETRVAILHRKAELRNVRMPGEVIEYIATAITSNIRELDGAITKVVGYASLLNEPITVQTARTALHEPRGAQTQVTIEDIVRVVTEEFGVRVADMQSKKRTRSIVLPRQVCMYLARLLTPHSLEEIGRYFGGRDHSTVIHAEDKIRSNLTENSSLARTIDNLKNALRVST